MIEGLLLTGFLLAICGGVWLAAKLATLYYEEKERGGWDE